jgi:hypothetical protein
MLEGRDPLRDVVVDGRIKLQERQSTFTEEWQTFFTFFRDLVGYFVSLYFHVRRRCKVHRRAHTQLEVYNLRLTNVGVPVHIIKACRGSIRIAPFILNLLKPSGNFTYHQV